MKHYEKAVSGSLGTWEWSHHKNSKSFMFTQFEDSRYKQTIVMSKKQYEDLSELILKLNGK